MIVAGYVYFILLLLIYVSIGAYGAMWSKYDKEKSSIYYLIHGVSSFVLMLLYIAGFYIFKGKGNQSLVTFNMIYIYIALDLGVSIYTWYKLNPFFINVLKEYGDIITYKKPCNELSKKQRVLYGFYKPTFNIVLLIWHAMFIYFSMTIFINFIITTL